MGKVFQTINKIKMRGGSFNYAQETKKHTRIVWIGTVCYFFTVFPYGWSQDSLSNRRVKRLLVQDTVVVDSLSINPSFFELVDTKGIPLPKDWYEIDYANGTLHFSEAALQQLDSVQVAYRYPLFLTRKVFPTGPGHYRRKHQQCLGKTLCLGRSNTNTVRSPLKGWIPGSITRGITVGNNQNAVVNSELDTNYREDWATKKCLLGPPCRMPIFPTRRGYSQSLDEFDQILLELYSDQWNIRAGDVDLQNSAKLFWAFQKKFRASHWPEEWHKDGSQTSAFMAGGLVQGVFQRSQFTADEGNQGPYKLSGPNGELYILIVSGSERVYVNGLLLTRGENADYVIDYNAGELKFNPPFPSRPTCALL